MIVDRLAKQSLCHKSKFTHDQKKKNTKKDIQSTYINESSVDPNEKQIIQLKCLAKQNTSN